MQKPRFRTLPADFIMNWLKQPHVHTRVATYKDVLPGDWAAYMMPGLVDWRSSTLRGDDGRYHIRNVNEGGNILAGFTDFVTAEVPVNSLEEVQFILVPLDRMGSRGLVDHAMLRFVFNEHAPIRYALDDDARSTQTANDFLISWEAWRSPGHRFNLIEAFNPDAFKLCPRFYIAAHRFLEDSVKGRHWNCYPLDMHDGERGLSEVLQMALSLADSVSRKTLSSILKNMDHGMEDSSIANADTQYDNLCRREIRCEEGADWQDVDAMIRSKQLPDSPIDDMPNIYSSYQVLLRSCATLALHTIELAAKRMSSQGILSRANTSVFDKLEIIKPVPWLEAMKNSNLKNIVRQAPYALWWIARHQEVIPTKMPGILQKAGLLKMKDGLPIMYHYFSGQKSPYIGQDVFRSD